MNLPTKQKQNNRTDLSLPKKVGVDEGSIKSLELADANYYTGFPGGSEVEDLPAIQEMLVQSWVRKIPLRRKWQYTPVLLPGKSHGQKSLVGCVVHGVTKESDTT